MKYFSGNLYFYYHVIASALRSRTKRGAVTADRWNGAFFTRVRFFFWQSNKRDSESRSTVVKVEAESSRFMWANHLSGCQDFVGPPLCARHRTSRYCRITDRTTLEPHSGEKKPRAQICAWCVCVASNKEGTPGVPYWPPPLLLNHHH